MPTKLGFQLHDGADMQKALEQLARLRPVAVMVLDNADLVDTAYKILGAEPLYVYQRYDMEDAHDFIKRHDSIENAVEQFMDDIRVDLERLRWVYHCTFTSDRITPELAQFEALAIQRVYEEYGVRLCVGNFATGSPAPDNWLVYRPVLEAAAQYYAVVGMRESYPILPYAGYGPGANIPDVNATNARRLRNEIPYPQVYHEPGQFVGHYRHLRDYLRREKLSTQILITETGAGRVATQWLDAFGGKPGYWRSLDTIWRQMGFDNSQRHYFEDLVWLDQHVYAQDSEVIAICVYATNTPDSPDAEIVNAPSLMNALENYMQQALRDQPKAYQEIPLPKDSRFTVRLPRVRIRAIPSLNTKYIGGLDYGETFIATHYALNDGVAWLKHRLGWSAFASLVNDKVDYDNRYIDGVFIIEQSPPPQVKVLPQQAATASPPPAGVSNFVGTIDEVRSFLAAHQDNLFYIAINPETPPDGARRFTVTTFPVSDSRRIIDELHPASGDPLMTPGAKRAMRDAGQL
ncbi:MAG TPA: hypothetical protein VJZ27_20325 [Aggregatilineales bacterium]|nr:hypothetical protein [Aggregatilineales bacterium]